jgi:hypothetical protein
VTGVALAQSQNLSSPITHRQAPAMSSPILQEHQLHQRNSFRRAAADLLDITLQPLPLQASMVVARTQTQSQLILNHSCNLARTNRKHHPLMSMKMTSQYWLPRC